MQTDALQCSNIESSFLDGCSTQVLLRRKLSVMLHSYQGIKYSLRMDGELFQAKLKVYLQNLTISNERFVYFLIDSLNASNYCPIQFRISNIPQEYQTEGGSFKKMRSLQGTLNIDYEGLQQDELSRQLQVQLGKLPVKAFIIKSLLQKFILMFNIKKDSALCRDIFLKQSKRMFLQRDEAVQMQAQQ